MSWGQRGAQISFKEYAESSKWFHQFQLLDIPFEASKFRSSRGGDYQRLFVRPLLEKTGLDLLTVLEFSRNYQIEGGLY